MPMDTHGSKTKGTYPRCSWIARGMIDVQPYVTILSLLPLFLALFPYQHSLQYDPYSYSFLLSFHISIPFDTVNLHTKCVVVDLP